MNLCRFSEDIMASIQRTKETYSNVLEENKELSIALTHEIKMGMCICFMNILRFSIRIKKIESCQGWIQTVLWWVPSAEGTRFVGGSGGMAPRKILKFRLSEMPFPGFWGQLWEYYDFAKDHAKNWQNNTFQVFKACMARTADPRFKRRTVVASN